MKNVLRFQFIFDWLSLQFDIINLDNLVRTSFYFFDVLLFLDWNRWTNWCWQVLNGIGTFSHHRSCGRYNYDRWRKYIGHWFAGFTFKTNDYTSGKCQPMLRLTDISNVIVNGFASFVVFCSIFQNFCQ